MEDLGVAGRGLSEGRKLDQLSPGDAARRARGTSGSRVQGPAYRTEGLPLLRSSSGSPLLDTGVHAHQNAAAGCVFCLHALFQPVTMVQKVFPVRVSTGAGSFLAYMHMEGYCVRIHPHGP